MKIFGVDLVWLGSLREEKLGFGERLIRLTSGPVAGQIAIVCPSDPDENGNIEDLVYTREDWEAESSASLGFDKDGDLCWCEADGSVGTSTPGTLDTGSLDWADAYARAVRFGLTDARARERAADYVVYRVASREGHKVCQQGGATECARCGAYGTLRWDGPVRVSNAALLARCPS